RAPYLAMEYIPRVTTIIVSDSTRYVVT
ncbi:MAG: hypothetical protein QOJ73_5653, partial [Streptosporangiaceae bacterium]|nr:hypothetical protein [Streptosporangiaceae bacterium]